MHDEDFMRIATSGLDDDSALYILPEDAAELGVNAAVIQAARRAEDLAAMPPFEEDAPLWMVGL